MIAWVGHPLGGAHDVAEAFPDFGAEHRNIHIAIAGLVYARGDAGGVVIARLRGDFAVDQEARRLERSEEHTSELQSLMRISYAVFCLKTKIREMIRQSIQNN